MRLARSSWSLKRAKRAAVEFFSALCSVGGSSVLGRGAAVGFGEKSVGGWIGGIWGESGLPSSRLEASGEEGVCPSLDRAEKRSLSNPKFSIVLKNPFFHNFSRKKAKTSSF